MAAGSVQGADFDEVTSFLADHSWIFDFKLTRIFQDEVLANIPLEWKETFINLSFNELAELPFGKIKTEWPGSLKLFIQNCVKFSSPREISELQQNFPNFTPVGVSQVDPEIRRGMSHKKIHEVCHLTSLIDHVTRKVGNNGVVDVGSGLGYLGQVLHCNYGHSVLGLEGKQGHTTGADRRINKFENCQHLHNVTCELTQQIQSQQEFLCLIQDWFSKLTSSGHQCCHFKTGTNSFQTQNKSHQTGSCETQKDQIAGDETLKDIGEKYGKQTGFIESSKTGSQAIPEEYLSECSKIEKLKTNFTEEASCQTGSGKMMNSDSITSSNEREVSDFSPSHEEMDHSACIKYSKEKEGRQVTSSSKGMCCTKCSDISTCSTKDGSDFMASHNEIDGIDLTVNRKQNTYTLNKLYSNQSSTACCNTKDQQIGAKDDAIVKSDDIPQLCMVGLHCCGDLTPTMLKHFVKLDQITSLCCVSCCYHRMNFDEDTKEHDNFPLSQLLKRSMAKTQQTHPHFKFSSYCLRLAAQETRARWREQSEMDHDFHMRNVAYRGVLETCLQQDDETFQLQKNVRKLAHKRDYESFVTYIEAVFKHIHKPGEVSEEELRKVFRDKMQQKYANYQHYFSLIEPLTALQYLLQPVIESLIYLDRKQWLQEQGLYADIVPVFDELVSPRNLALVAWK